MNVALFLAEAAGTDPMISGTWVTGFVVALLGAVGTLIGYSKGKASPTTRIDPIPLPVEIVETLATKDEMKDLEARLVREIKKLEHTLNRERENVSAANDNLHARITTTGEALANMTGQLKQIDANLSRLINLQLTKGRTS